jgi:hypothetical protein
MSFFNYFRAKTLLRRSNPLAIAAFHADQGLSSDETLCSAA